MKNIILAAVFTVTLTGCAGFGWRSVEPVKIKKEEVARTPLNLPDPAPLKPTAPAWIVITPSTADRVWKQLETNNQDLVLFALTDDGYEALAVDTAETRNYIARMRQILQEYRRYYEPAKPDAAQ
jgi:hypothetical protein